MSALDQCVIYKVAIGSLGTRRKANTGAVTVKAQNGGVDPDRDQVYVAKEILDHPRLDAVFKAQQDLRKFLALRSLPSILERGHYAVPKPGFKEVRDGVKTHADKISKKVDEFLLVYETAKSDAKKKLGALYDSDDYPDPDQIKKAFYVRTRIRSLGLPEDVKSLIGDDAFKEESKVIEEDNATADEELTLHMRTQYLEYSSRLVDRLSPDENGKPKVFHDTLISNLTNYHAFFPQKNVTSDVILKQLVEKGTLALDGIEAADLRGSNALRVKTLAVFNPIVKELTSILPKNGRKVVLD